MESNTETAGLAQAIKEIERLVTAANRTTLLEARGERGGVYFLVGPDGRAERVLAEPAWSAERLATPAELLRFIQERAGEKSAVFFGESGATFFYDRDDRRAKASCELVTSPQYQWLAHAKGGVMSQADLVRLLRITFRGCLPADGNLLALVRNLKFSTAGEAAVSIQHGRESLGKRVEAAVTGEGVLPEEVTLFIPVFENHPFKARVACALEVCPHEQGFRLTPYPLEVRNALDAAVEDVGTLLTASGLPPAYRGQA